MRRMPRAPGSAPPPHQGPSGSRSGRARLTGGSAGLLAEPAPRNQVVPVGLGVSLRVLSGSLLFPVNSPAPLDPEEERELSAAGKRALCRPRARATVRPSIPAAPRAPRPALRVRRPPLALFRGPQVSRSAWRSLRPVSEHLRLTVNSPSVQALRRLAFKRSPVPPDARNVDPPGPFSGAASWRARQGGLQGCRHLPVQDLLSSSKPAL